MPERQLNTVKCLGYYKKQKVTVIDPINMMEEHLPV